MGAIERQASARRRSVVVGSSAICLGIALLLFAITAQNGIPGYIPGVDRKTVKLAFDDVGSLLPGDEVRIANVRAGYVESIELAGQKPVATLKLDGDRPVYRDMSANAAQIGARSALGQKFVELNPGDPSSGELPDGLVVPVRQEGNDQELDDLLGVLDERTRQATGSTIREVGGGLAGHQQDVQDGVRALPGMLPDLGTVSGALSANGGADLSSMLTAADRLSRSFDGNQHQLGELVGHLDSTVAAANVDGGEPLDQALQSAPDALRQTRSALSDVRAPLHSTEAAMRDLHRGAAGLGEATPDLRGVLREGVRPLNRVPGVAESAEPALDELTPAVRDARPLVQQLGTTVDRAQTPLQVIAPYAPEVSLFFTFAQSALSQGDAAGRWLRFYPVLETENVTGTLPIKDPTSSREAYPAPGVAGQHEQKTLLGERGVPGR